MKSGDLSILKRKFARRIFLQFFVCAIFPILGLTIVSYPLVKGELEKFGEGRLHEFNKYLSLSVYDRLKSLEAELSRFSSELKVNATTAGNLAMGADVECFRSRCKAVGIINDTGKAIPLLGDFQDSLVLPAQNEWQHLRSGKALITLPSAGDNAGRTLMMKLIDLRDESQGLLVAEIDAMYLWGLSEEKALPALTDLFVLDKSAKVVFSTHPEPPPFMVRAEFHQSRSSGSGFEWRYDGETYLTAYRALFTQYQWFYPKLTVVLSAPKSDVYALIDYFRKIFPTVIVLSVLIIALLTASQIRRTTEPLARLKEATGKIAFGAFDTRVTISSGDEFQEVGEKFNDMAKQLGWQFDAMKTLAEIDRAVLSALDINKIIDTVVSGFKRFFACDMVAVTLFDLKNESVARTYGRYGDHNSSRSGEIIEISREEFSRFIDNRDVVSVSPGDRLPRYFRHLMGGSFQKLVMLPLVIRGNLTGTITIVWRNTAVLTEKTMVTARQLADQVAVALSNGRLLQALEDLTWASLYALANAVDEKSPWTHDHSKRVAWISKAIGRVMGLSPEAMTDLERAALVHDIGKIGIADRILTKPDRLSKDEREEMERHPQKGAEILAPLAQVPSFAQIVAMVVQHHEHFDGSGYPDGLAGDRIDLGARILAAADVYDALISNRPYREGVSPELGLEMIRKYSGHHFDPVVVDALMKALQQDRLHAEGELSAFGCLSALTSEAI